MTIDMRCPDCDHPLVGKDQVIITKTKAPETLTCKRCKVIVKLVTDKEGTVDYYYSKEVA